MDSADPYAPPESGLVEPHQIESPYYAVSVFRFVTLSLATLGLFELYWFYQNWRRERVRTGERLSPFWRAFFAPLWAFSCFTRLRQAADTANTPSTVSPGLLGVSYLILSMVWRLPDPFWLVSILTFLPLLPANLTAARLNRALAPGSQALTPWSVATVFLTLLGLPFLVLTVAVTMFPDLVPAE